LPDWLACAERDFSAFGHLWTPFFPRASQEEGPFVVAGYVNGPAQIPVSQVWNPARTPSTLAAVIMGRYEAWMAKLRSALRVVFFAAVAAVSVANVIYNAKRVPPRRTHFALATNPGIRQEQRFSSMRRALNARKITGTIGYIADIPPAGMAADEQGVEDYYRAQFSLAPIVLDQRAERYDWAIADFRGTPPGKRLPDEWRVVEDSGNGVLLLEKASR